MDKARTILHPNMPHRLLLAESGQPVFDSVDSALNDMRILNFNL